MRLLRDFTQDRCLARLDLGLWWGCSLTRLPTAWVWLTFGLRPAGGRDEAWLKKGLPSS